MPTCTCGRRRRALAAAVKRLMNRGYLCRALSGRFSDFESEAFGLVDFADVACLLYGRRDCPCFGQPS